MIKFLGDDLGAVTIDWVAITAGVLMLGLVAIFAIYNNGVSTLVSKTNSTLGKMNISVPSTTLQ